LEGFKEFLKDIQFQGGLQPMQYWQMIFLPVNYFLYSLVLSWALPCARPENLELLAHLQLPPEHSGSIPIPMAMSVKMFLHAGKYLWLCQLLAP
jgi:hypothetical protein